MYRYTLIRAILAVIAVHLSSLATAASLTPNHMYDEAAQRDIVDKAARSQLCSTLAHLDIKAYAEARGVTPEHLVRRVYTERDRLSPDEVVQYIKYRIAHRLQQRLQSLASHTEPDAPDAYLQFWLHMDASLSTCEDAVAHIVRTLCNDQISISSTMTHAGLVTHRRYVSGEIDMQLYIQDDLLETPEALFMTVEHEITHLEQGVNGSDLTPLYREHPVTTLDKPPRDQQIEAEADYHAAIFCPVPQQILSQCIDTIHPQYETIPEDEPYLSRNEYAHFLREAKGALPVAERKRQDTVVHATSPARTERRNHHTVTHAASPHRFIQPDQAHYVRRDEKRVRRSIVCIMNQEEVGWIRFQRRTDDSQGSIESLEVAKECRHQGIGTSLLQLAIEDLENDGVEVIHLWSVPNACRFYERWGMHQCFLPLCSDFTRFQYYTRNAPRARLRNTMRHIFSPYRCLGIGVICALVYAWMHHDNEAVRA